MLTVATCLWDANEKSFPFSRCYDESWVDKLYRGFARNLTVPFNFECFVDRDRSFGEPVFQERLIAPASYASYIEPFRLDGPMIMVGLDTVILRNIDHLAEWCMAGRGMIALPRDPFHWSRGCNGVVLVQEGTTEIFEKHRGENDMEWLRRQPHVFVDDIFPGSVKSYKGHVRGMTLHFEGRPQGYSGIDMLYLHGVPKQPQLVAEGDDIIRRNWI